MLHFFEKIYIIMIDHTFVMTVLSISGVFFMEKNYGTSSFIPKEAGIELQKLPLKVANYTFRCILNIYERSGEYDR